MSRLYTFLLSAFCYWTTEAFFDFYLNKIEMRRLFGKSVQLDYVKNGEVNYYALNASMPVNVPPDIEHIIFSWKASVHSEVAYSISMYLDDEDGLILPLLNDNITDRGLLPFSEQSFAVNLRCKRPNTYNVSLSIKIVFYPVILKKNTTTVLIKRQKVCLRPLNLIVATPHIEKFGSAEHIFYVAIGCVFAFVILMATLLVAYFTRKKPTEYDLPAGPNKHLLTYPTVSYTKACYEDQYNPNPSIKNRHSPSKSTFSSRHYEPSELYVNSSSFDLPRVQRFEILSAVDDPRVDISCREMIIDESIVTIGQLEVEASSASVSQVQRLLSSSLIFRHLKPHPNLLQPAFVCGSPWPNSPRICYDHSGYGNLKKFLQRCRNPIIDQRQLSSLGNELPPFSSSLVTQDLVKMALNIIRGVSYLHRNRMLHKDLATRNCIIDFDLVVQVCNDALSRDLFPQDYHCLGDNENRPLKWLSIEAMENHDFSTASDVWAFGITLWELVTLAQQPYSDIDPFEMLPCLIDGQRLLQPYNCPDELFLLMYCCWNKHTEARPTFDELHKALQHFYNQLTKFV